MQAALGNIDPMAPAVGTMVSVSGPASPIATPSTTADLIPAPHPLVGLPVPHSVGANFHPLGLTGDAKEHWSKALSAVLRWEYKHDWVNRATVLHGLKTSSRFGELSDHDLDDVLRGSRRFESRVHDGAPQLRAVEKPGRRR